MRNRIFILFFSVLLLSLFLLSSQTFGRSLKTVLPVVPLSATPVLPTTGSHAVALTFTAPPDATSGTTYNAYRATTSCPATAPATVAAAITAGFAKLNAAGFAPTSYTDATVAVGPNCYFVTQVQAGIESVPSNTAGVSILPLAPTGMTIGSFN